MQEPGRLPFPAHDRNGIEAVEIRGVTVARHPGACHGFDLAALGPRDRLERMAVAVAGPRLHLDEGNDVAAAGDQVDLFSPKPEVARDDAPTFRLEQRCGERL